MMVDYEKRFEKQRLELERKHLRDSLERVKRKAIVQTEKEKK